ncbi:MAG: hypothetical protein RLZZ127_1965 [Planctomycetota bacterium]|jgi:prepilin-type N-terminal cleavage/methylation domain-containing protein
MAHARLRGGLTLIEVMIALAVIATGVMALMNGIYSQSVARKGVRDSERVVDLTAAIQERLLSEAWPVLGVSAWSTPQVFSESAPFAGGHSEQELLASGIISQPTGLRNLRLYLEYYLAQSRIVGFGSGAIELRGLMDAQTDIDGDGVVDLFADETSARAGYAVNIASATAASQAGSARTVRYDEAPAANAPKDQPIAIRAVVVWEGSGSNVFGVKSLPGSNGRMFEMIIARGAN